MNTSDFLHPVEVHHDIQKGPLPGVTALLLTLTLDLKPFTAAPCRNLDSEARLIGSNTHYQVYHASQVKALCFVAGIESPALYTQGKEMMLGNQRIITPRYPRAHSI